MKWDQSQTIKSIDCSTSVYSYFIPKLSPAIKDWSTLVFCATSNGNKLEIVASWIHFSANLNLSWCFKWKLKDYALCITWKLEQQTQCFSNWSHLATNIHLKEMSLHTPDCQMCGDCGEWKNLRLSKINLLTELPIKYFLNLTVFISSTSEFKEIILLRAIFHDFNVTSSEINLLVKNSLSDYWETLKWVQKSPSN